ncbi:hypothetical protein [Pseudopedobacter beijingensis]|uniref:Uncharacterized protein n=1 Tax=Pseudopedobacter beijingensis TaxID=1207056 RepID=A0ABW4IH47_9SPHI
MKQLYLFLACFFSVLFLNAQTPEFYFNGGADVIFRYPPRGFGGRAFVHDDGNVLTLNYGGDFTGGTRIGNNFSLANNGIAYFYSWSPTGAAQGDLYVDVIPGTRILRTRNWNEQSPNVGATGFLTGSGYFLDKVGIGTQNPTETLSVNGKIRAKEIKVETANWPDYVFDESDQLPDLRETELH